MRKGIKILIFITFLTTNLICQTVEYMGNGTYQFENNYQPWDLHFYLFDDGYHSFDSNPIHQYKNTSIPAEPVYYHTEGYTSDDPTENMIGVIDLGSALALQPTYQLNNQIEIKRSWNMVNLSENYFLLMFENSQFPNPVSGCVEFHFNYNDISINIEDILDDYNNNWVEGFEMSISSYSDFTHKYTWYYNSLKPGEQRFVYIPALCLSPTMSTILTRGVMKINSCNVPIPENGKTDGSNEGIFDSQIYTLSSVVSNYPYDPNILISEPNCISQDTLTQIVRYRLYFQNEGITASEDVEIRINSSLNFGNVKLLDASYSCQLIWEPEKIHISFDDMYIQGLNQPDTPEYEETIGWVEFDICYNLQDLMLDEEECVDLEAQVFFDSQSPIVALNHICVVDSCSRNSILEQTECFLSDSSQGFIHESNHPKILEDNLIGVKDLQIVYPNPAKNIINIDVKDENGQKVIIYNTNGSIVFNGFSSGRVDVSGLQQGLYFIQIIGRYKYRIEAFTKN